MAIENLKHSINDLTAKISVIGLGYVGLPVAASFAEKRFDVLGIEVKPERVEMINQGISPIEGKEPGLSELLAKVVGEKKLHATTDYNQLKDRDIILIDVETPVDNTNTPRYEALKNSLRHLGPVLKSGALVIIESTIAPGTMQDLVHPILEESSGFKLNTDFYLGNCPERVMPGKLLANLKTMSRVVGGSTPETATTMIALYRHVVQADLDPVDWITAELVKTTENAYRDVQIAFANEVALICETLGANVWEVRELVNKTPFRYMHLPGTGVGGHCIPKDPWLLAYSARGMGVPIRLISAAREINNSMPLHTADLAQQALSEVGQELSGAKILVMGFSYLEDTDDTRNSPSEVLASHLQEKKASVVIHDPFVAGYQGNILQMADGCDTAIVMVAHSEYRLLDLKALKSVLRTPVLVDGRNVYDPGMAVEAGLIYKGIGR